MWFRNELSSLAEVSLYSVLESVYKTVPFILFLCFGLCIPGYRTTGWMTRSSNPSRGKRRGSETNITAVRLALSPVQSVLGGRFPFDKAAGVWNVDRALRWRSKGRVGCVWNVMAYAHKPYFVFRRNGRGHLNRRGRQFSRLLAAELCELAVVMLDTPCSELVWRVLANHSSFPFTPPPVRHRVPSRFHWTVPPLPKYDVLVCTGTSFLCAPIHWLTVIFASVRFVTGALFNTFGACGN